VQPQNERSGNARDDPDQQKNAGVFDTVDKETNLREGVLGLRYRYAEGERIKLL
jgi:hypothetical protein